MPSDTPPEVERIQIAMLREAGPIRRYELASSLTNSCIDRAKAAIRRAMPEADELARQHRYVELQYGRHLADAFADYVKRRQS